MAGLKKFKMGGVDLASNDLVRDQLKSSDLRNTIKNQKGDISGRNGYEEEETAPFLIEEVVYHKSTNQDIFIAEDGSFHKLYNGNRVPCSIAKLFPNTGLILKNRIITDEYLSNMYVTTNDGSSRVVKFDGSDAYLAGMPAPTFKYDGSDSTISSPGAGFYFRYFYGHKDVNGNLTFGPYVQETSTVNNPTITVSSMRAFNPYGDFYDKYLITNMLSNFTVTSVNNSFPYAVTNYNIGDKFLIDPEVLFPAMTTLDPAGLKWKAVTIINITPTDIFLDPIELGTFTFSLVSGPAVNLDTRTRFYIYKSISQTFGYQSASTTIDGVLTQFALNNTQNDNSFQATSAVPDLVFEDLYSEEGQKLTPPKCKYLTAYGDQLIYGNIVGVWDQENKFVQYNNDDLIIPSDFGIGDNGENNSANVQRIGESYDGAINGIKRCNDLLVAVKDNAVYALDGIIEPGGYSLRKIPTNYIGCLNQNSMIQVQGGLFFHGNDGVYFTNGSECYKTSELIDPFFNGILPSRSKATVSRKFQSFLFYMTDGTTEYCLAYMYQFKEWFIWDALDMHKGLYERNNADVVFSNGDVLYRFNDSYSDNGVAINHMYSTNWEDLREPSVTKKFKMLRLWNLNKVPTSYKIKVQKDWKDTVLDTVDVTLGANETFQKGFDQRNCKAIRFVFENTTLGENMLITGYELEYEGSQNIDKGGSNA